MQTQTDRVYQIEHALDLAFKPNLSSVKDLRDLNEWLNSTLPDILFASSGYSSGSFGMKTSGSNMTRISPTGQTCINTHNVDVAGVLIEQSRFKFAECSYISKVLPEQYSMCCNTGEESAEPFADLRFVFDSAPWGYYRNCANFTMNVRASWVSRAVLPQLVLAQQFTIDNAFQQLARSDSAFDSDPDLHRLSRMEVVDLFSSFVQDGCSSPNRQYIYVDADDKDVKETFDSLGGANWPWAADWACAADPDGCARVTEEANKVCMTESSCSVGWTAVLCQAGTKENVTGSDSDSDSTPDPACGFSAQSAALLFCNGSVPANFVADVSPILLNLTTPSPIQLGLDPSTCVPYIERLFSLSCGVKAEPPLTCLTSVLCRSNEACTRSFSASVLQVCATSQSNHTQNQKYTSAWTASQPNSCPSSIPTFIEKATGYLDNLSAAQQKAQELSAQCKDDPACVMNGRYQAQVLCGAPWTCWSTLRKEFARSVIARRLVEEHLFSQYCFFAGAYEPVHGPRPTPQNPSPTPTSSKSPPSDSARANADVPFTTNFARSMIEADPSPTPDAAENGTALDAESFIPPGLECILPEDSDVSSEPFKAFLSMFVPASFNRKFLSFLVQRRWLTSATKAVKVDVLVFNPHIQLLTFVQINFDIGPTGTVFPSLQYLTCDMFVFSDSSDFRRVALEICFLVCFAIQCLTELVQIIRAVRQKRFRRHAWSLWTFLLWSNIFFTLLVIASWALQLYFLPMLAATHLELSKQSAAKDSFDEFVYLRIFPGAQRWLSVSRVYTYFNSMNIFFLFARSLSFLSFQGKMSLFNRTLMRSFSMLFHFVLVSMFIVVGFAEIGKLSFGHRVPEFRTFAHSLSTCFNMVLQTGDVDASYIVAAEGFDPHKAYIAHFFYTMFNLFVTIILVNLFLAIVLEGYTYVAGHAAGSASLLEELALLLDTAKASLVRLANAIHRRRSKRSGTGGSLDQSEFKLRSDRELLLKLENIDPDLDKDEYQCLLEYVARKTLARNKPLRTSSLSSSDGRVAHGAEYGGYRAVRQMSEGSGTLAPTPTTAHHPGRRGASNEDRPGDVGGRWDGQSRTNRTASDAGDANRRGTSSPGSSANWVGGGLCNVVDGGHGNGSMDGPGVLAAEMRGSKYMSTWGWGAGRSAYRALARGDDEGDDPAGWDIMDGQAIDIYRKLSRRFDGVDLLAESSAHGTDSADSLLQEPSTHFNTVSGSSEPPGATSISQVGSGVSVTSTLSSRGMLTGPHDCRAYREYGQGGQTRFNVPKTYHAIPVTASASSTGDLSDVNPTLQSDGTHGTHSTHNPGCIVTPHLPCGGEPEDCLFHPDRPTQRSRKRFEYSPTWADPKDLNGEGRHHRLQQPHHQRIQIPILASAAATQPSHGSSNNDSILNNKAEKPPPGVVSITQVGLDGMLDSLESPPLVPLAPLIPIDPGMVARGNRHMRSWVVRPVGASLQTSSDNDEGFLAQRTDSGLRQRRARGSGSESESEGRLLGSGLSPSGREYAGTYRYNYSPSHPGGTQNFAPSLNGFVESQSGFVEVSSFGPVSHDGVTPSTDVSSEVASLPFTSLRDVTPANPAQELPPGPFSSNGNAGMSRDEQEATSPVPAALPRLVSAANPSL